MFRKVTIFSHKIISLLLVLVFLQLFIMAYVVSLVIVKPRDVTGVFLLASKYFISNDEEIKIDSEKVTLSWNKSELSFDFNFIDNKVTFNDHIVSIPHLVVDISKRSLFLWRFKIDQIKIRKLEYHTLARNDNLNIANNEYINSVLSEDYSPFLSDILDKVSHLGNIKIYELFVYDADKLLYQLNNLLLEQNKHFIALDFDLHTKDNKQIKFDGKCRVKGNLLKNCNIAANNVSNKILQSIGIDLPDVFVNMDIVFDIRKFDHNYEIGINAKIYDLVYAIDERNFYYNNLKLESDISVGKDSLLIRNISFSNQEKNISLELLYVPNDKNITFKLYGQHINEKEIFVLWPEQVAFKARRWLKKSLLQSELSKFELSANLLLTDDKPKINSLLGNFYFNNTDLEFVKFFKPIEDASGVVRLVNKKLDIKINKAAISQAEISDFTAVIPKLSKRGSILYINGDIDSKGSNLIDFLLSKNISDQQLGILYQLFGENYADLRLALQVRLKKPVRDQDIKLALIGELKDLSGFFDQNSKAKIRLEKDFDTKIFNSEIDLRNSKITVPFIEYNKNWHEYLLSNFRVHKMDSKFIFDDITLIGDKENMLGMFSLSKKGLETLKIYQARLSDNYFSLDYIKDGKQRIFKLISDKLQLRTINLSNVTQKNNYNIRNMTFDFDIKSLNFDNHKSISDVHSKYVCYESCDLFYVQGAIDKASQIFIKYFTAETLNNKKSIIEKSGDKITKLIGDIIPSKVQEDNHSNDKITKLIIETNNLGSAMEIFDISDKLSQGSMHFTAEKKADKFIGKALLSDLYVKNIKFFKALSELRIYRNRGLENKEELLFDKGVAHISFNDKLLSIKDTVFYGKLFGITTEGNVLLNKRLVDLQGLIVPAYKINNLLGVKDIPVIGKMITGGKNKGLLSASYDVKGEYDNLEFNFNPLTVVLPSFLRNIIDVLSLKKDRSGDVKKIVQ